MAKSLLSSTIENVIESFWAGTTKGLKITTAEYIYSNTCNNVTCSYESAIDTRTTVFTVKAANGNRLFVQNVIHVMSSNVCTPDGNAHCRDIGTCWCDPNGFSTSICYNYTSGGEGQLTLGCATRNQHIETLATIAAIPSNIHPNNMIYSVNEGSIFGPLICNASCGPSCTFGWVGPDSVINSSVLLFNPATRKENGTYQCGATNAIGTIIANIVLIVQPGSTSGLTIATAEYIYPNTCNNITCSYESAIGERTTMFAVTTANGNRLFQHNIIHMISSNICALDGYVHCYSIGICWCDPNGFSTSICYNHTSGGEGQLTLQCTTTGQNEETFATIAANPSNIRPNNMTYSVNEGSIFGPLICNASCGPPCTFRWVGPDYVINSTVLFFNPATREENGIYQCEATNTIGTIIANSVLIVKYGPNKVILSPNTSFILLNEGSDVPNIKCKADCQPGCTFTWITPNGQVESKILNIKNIQINQTGTYKCNASNEVSHMVSAGVTITVVYSPTILQLEVLTGNTVDENQSVYFRCDVNGYPVPNISWIFSTTNTLLKKEENVFKSNYVIPKANCFHTGTYRCQGSNVIDGGLSSAFSEIDLFVLCSARADQRYQEEPVDIVVMENGDLNITVFLLAYPKPIIMWTMKSSDTGQDYTVKYNNSVNIVEHVSTVNIVKVSKKDYGVYTIIAYNNVGPAFVKSFTVAPQGPPQQPTDVLVICEITSMIVSWLPGSNGGFEQTFIVEWLNTNTQHTYYSLEIKDSDQKRIQQYIVKSLYPETMYVIHVEATNKHGTVRSTQNANCTTGL
ncbi:Hypothetical predicted protein, partial [Mytilus galloprovincialis]